MDGEEVILTVVEALGKSVVSSAWLTPTGRGTSASKHVVSECSRATFQVEEAGIGRKAR